jgi:pyruvate/2-oxoglutarate/acetoin dehydrogenase E1 component
MVQAVNAALARALRSDERVILFGEDVGIPGGIFGASKGLREEFGDRVFDMPISEAAILGAAIGAAQMGLRPIAEIMWSDFTLVALDQLVNQAANVRYVSNGDITAPLTVRMQQGVTPGSCAQHSQSLEAIFAHTPGLRVGIPSTAADAYSMLLAAVADPDPVIIIESRAMYGTVSDPVDESQPVTPIGGAVVRRPGRHATVVSWGRMVHECLAAADQLSAQGIELEVVDLRWLNPLDNETVMASVRSTAHLAVVHEANVTGGFGAEIAARVYEDSFFDLDGPVLRIGVDDLRMPAAPHLQGAVVPSAGSIVDRIVRWLST